MKRLLTYLLCAWCVLTAVAQVNVRGTVAEHAANKPLSGVSVMVKGADGKIKKFTSTKADGVFAMQLPTVAGCRLEITKIGFARLSLPLDSAAFPLTVHLEKGSTQLKEVTVKADRIREQGDTITYNVGSFAQAQDQSIGDVLKRMPGINVADNGQIKYQGKDINKFYIENSDLLGGKYGIATNGINHDDVGAVEVMENHQPLQVLSGLAYSDRAAINLKLKNKAKANWNIHGKAGGGWSWQPEDALWYGEFFAMAVMPKFQHITTLRTNNLGLDLASSNTDFFAGERGTALSRYVGVGLPGTPSLNRMRTFFNRSFLASTNSLRKLKNGEFKANVDYAFNRVTAQSTDITTYFLDGGNRVVTENSDGTQHAHALSGKFIYEVNQKTAYVNNILLTNINWNDAFLHTTGSIPNSQSADTPDYYAANRLKIIKRFKGKHLITFDSRNDWESLPQTLRLNVSGTPYRQHVADHAFSTQESVAYTFAVMGVTVSLEAGLNGYWRTMNSELPELPEALPGLTENTVRTNSLAIYAAPRLEYWKGSINLALNLPVSYAHYSFHKAIANRDEVYFSPSLSLNWKPNHNFTGTLEGGTGCSPMNFNLIHPGLIMTNYRIFNAGTDDFYHSTSQYVSVGFNYRPVSCGLFADGTVTHSWNHVPYTLSQQLFGNYAVYSYADADNNGKSLTASGSVSKALNFMRGSVHLTGSFRRSESQLLSEQRSVQSVGTGWSVGGKILGTLWQRFSFDYSIGYSNSRLSMNGASAPWLSSMRNTLSLNVTPHAKWLWQVSGEHYRNELTEDKYKNIVLFDTKLIFRPSKHIELTALLTNILNKKLYNYITYSQLSSFESQRRLRGRQLLLSISFRK